MIFKRDPLKQQVVKLHAAIRAYVSGMLSPWSYFMEIVLVWKGFGSHKPSDNNSWASLPLTKAWFCCGISGGWGVRRRGGGNSTVPCLAVVLRDSVSLVDVTISKACLTLFIRADPFWDMQGPLLGSVSKHWGFGDVYSVYTGVSLNKTSNQTLGSLKNPMDQIRSWPDTLGSLGIFYRFPFFFFLFFFC